MILLECVRLAAALDGHPTNPRVPFTTTSLL